MVTCTGYVGDIVKHQFKTRVEVNKLIEYDFGWDEMLYYGSQTYIARQQWSDETFLLFYVFLQTP